MIPVIKGAHNPKRPAALSPIQQRAEAALRMAAAQRSTAGLRTALHAARTSGCPAALVSLGSRLLERLEVAEAKALSDLQECRGTRSQGPRKLLIVFDFDRTIAREHMWGTYRDAPLAQIPVNEDTFADLNAFRAFVNAAKRHGHHVAVATFGRAEVANKALEFALGKDHGFTITTPADFPDPGHQGAMAELCSGSGPGGQEVPRCPEGSSWLGNKNRQLALLGRLFKVAAADMVLFDDDPNNVREASKGGAMVQHTPDGLTAAILDRAAAALGFGVR